MSLRGGISVATAGRVSGWIFREGSSDPIEVELHINDQVIGTARADRQVPEPDRIAGGTRANCGFEFLLPRARHLKVGDRIVVVEVGSAERVPGLTMTIAVSGISTAAKAEPQPGEPSPEEVEKMRAILGRFPRVGRRSSSAIVRATLGAFTLRELRDRFGRSRGGYLWAILQPILFMLGFMAIRAALGRGREDIYDVSGMYFFWLGLAPFFMFLNGLNRAMGASRSYRALFQFRQIQPMDVIVVRLLIEFATMGVVFVILMTGFAWYGLAISADDVLGFVLVILHLYLLTLGLALCAEVALANYPESRQIITVIERPLFLLSGTFFTIDQVPPAMREWLLWNPLLHAVDLARGTMLAKYDPIGSWVYLSGCTLAALALGLGLYRQNRMKLIAQ